MRARIFERGVGETLSSGTGASGAAVTAFLRGAPSPIVVELDGGELEVEIGEDLAVRLTGWAEPVYAGELSPELLQALAELDQSSESLGSAPMAIADPSKRLEAMPPYMFAGTRAADRREARRRHRRDQPRHRRSRRADLPTHRRGDAGGGRRPGDPQVPEQPRPDRVPRGLRRLLRPRASASRSTPRPR